MSSETQERQGESVPQAPTNASSKGNSLALRLAQLQKLQQAEQAAAAQQQAGGALTRAGEFGLDNQQQAAQALNLRPVAAGASMNLLIILAIVGVAGTCAVLVLNKLIEGMAVISTENARNAPQDQRPEINIHCTSFNCRGMFEGAPKEIQDAIQGATGQQQYQQPEAVQQPAQPISPQPVQTPPVYDSSPLPTPTQSIPPAVPAGISYEQFSRFDPGALQYWQQVWQQQPREVVLAQAQNLAQYPSFSDRECNPVERCVALQMQAQSFEPQQGQLAALPEISELGLLPALFPIALGIGLFKLFSRGGKKEQKQDKTVYLIGHKEDNE